LHGQRRIQRPAINSRLPTGHYLHDRHFRWIDWHRDNTCER
jgi:hypothetical protein